MKIKDMTQIALFVAVMGILGLMPPIMLGFTPVPITLQTLGVFLAAGILGARKGFISQVIFLLLVAAGMPLLPGGRGGIGVFVGPSAGYLIGYAVATLCVGFVLSRFRSLGFVHILGTNLLVGTIVIYLFGMPIQAFVMNLPLLETIKVSLVFIPGDVIKAVLGAVVVYKMRKYPIIYRNFGHTNSSIKSSQ